MYTIRDNWTEPRGTTLYSGSGKSPKGVRAGSDDYVYDFLAQRIDEAFPEGATLSQIYHEVTSPLGLTLDDTRDIVRRAKQVGYLDSLRG